MLVVAKEKNCVINLNMVTDFCKSKERVGDRFSIRFYQNFRDTDGSITYTFLDFKDEKFRDEAFDKIIHYFDQELTVCEL